ncbi:MAG TPA: glycosyltransferase family 39 protein [Acidimicrobiales bacterium]|nr:glycosyltransferase family 39 protein [Acidimicrobiales bacterium]
MAVEALGLVDPPGSDTGEPEEHPGDAIDALDANDPPEPLWVDFGLAVAIAGGVVLRFWTGSALWLDEALSVNIARLPLSQLTEALRHDGAPPVYYVLLHGWMQVFGEGDAAVRALSGVLSVASLPLMYLAGRRLAGREAGWVATALLAMSPFALRYATETRMYALIVFLTLLGYLVLDRFLARPTTGRLFGIMVVSALLVLTHYWSLFLLAAVCLALAVRLDRAPRSRMATAWALIGVVVGALAILPWLPAFTYQLAHTGTPWARPPRVSSIIGTVFAFSGGDEDLAPVLGVCMLAVGGMGVFGRRHADRQVVLDLRAGGPAKGLGFVTLATLVTAIAAGLVTGSGFAPRYASVVLAPFLIVVATGAQALAPSGFRRAVVGVLVSLGLVAGVLQSDTPRTQARTIAATLDAEARPGDLVLYCPDQLGPAVDRYLAADLYQVTFPRLRPPDRVDWVDYEPRNLSVAAPGFAARVHRLAGSNAIWFVWAFGYQGLGGRCEQIDQNLANVRPVRQQYVVLDIETVPEHANLTRYAVPGDPQAPAPRRR